MVVTVREQCLNALHSLVLTRVVTNDIPLVVSELNLDAVNQSMPIALPPSLSFYCVLCLQYMYSLR